MNTGFGDYTIQPVPFTNASIADDFWKRRIDTAINITIPYDFEKCEETGRIDNFAKAGGLMDGPHQGIFYDDSDVFKVAQGAAYALQVAPNPALEAYLDELIDKFAAAQEDDGYLYTARTIDPDNVPEPCGPKRWSNLAVNHELYNVGHMYEAAVAYFQATGKRGFLDIAVRNADLIDSVFGPEKLRDVPGHQEIEIGLVALYRATGDARYLRLARYFLDERGQENGRQMYGHYCQDHRPVTEQREAVGHAVRAGYMYAAMTDIAALYGDAEYAAAVKELWGNVVGKKLALTGGIGARHDGEAFGADYELPNLTAYNETCAAQANILWNHRLFLLTGEAKYIDILERTLYNGFLSGVGMDGRSFYYVNPLACDGEYRFNRALAMSRQPWYQTSCCPTNVVRLLPSLSGYIYALRQNAVFVNLYIAGSADLTLASAEARLELRTDYPWSGRIQLDVTVSEAATFDLKLRIPAFAQGQPLPSKLYRYLDEHVDAASLAVDGKEIPIEINAGYAAISRRWTGATRVEFQLPLPIQRVVANDAVADLQGKVALERGPLVYALESADNDAPVLDLALPDSSQLRAEYQPGLLGGLTTIRGHALEKDGGAVEFTAIPYYAWGHRGDGPMTVWLNNE
ncbi:MAG: glycoside hydrolase family 127 protein [Chloroflexi bacterium]|nr:glycoside hydrolase family 127 protein [Chloroflexota bacterium]